MFKYSLLIIGLLFVSTSPTSANSLAGDWQGSASTPDEQTGFMLHINPASESHKVSVSLPDIGVSKWPAHNVSLSRHKVSFDLPSDSGPQQVSLRVKDNMLVGTWQDNAGQEASRLVLTLSEKVEDVPEYRILIPGNAGNIGVSYMLPPGISEFSDIDCKNSIPGVVLTHGSGPMSRDSNRFTAQSFARQGVLAIFYDKRGIAETKGDYDLITFDQLAEDAISVAEHFAKMSCIKSIGFWGHSQGGWIAPLALSKWQSGSFAIMSAGPLVTPAREAEWTFVQPVSNNPDARVAVQKIVSSWHSGLRSDSFSRYRDIKEQYEDEEWFDTSGVDNLRTLFLGQFYDSYKLYMDYDPLPTFAKLDKPIMAIFTPDDESINSQESIDIARQLQQQGKAIELVKYPGYSHSMRKLERDGQALRFPNHPIDYFQKQADFIKRVSIN